MHLPRHLHSNLHHRIDWTRIAWWGLAWRLAALLALGAKASFGATLDEWVVDAKQAMPAEGSGLYTAPDAQARADWSAVVSQMLNGDCGEQLPASLAGYTRGWFHDTDIDRDYCILAAGDADEDGIADVPWGSVVVNPDPAAQPLSIDVPHPLNDSGTPEQGIAIFKGTGAHAFLMAGAHRDANDVPCACVDPQYGEADPAHNINHAFHASAAAVLAHYDGLGIEHRAFQFHGMGESTCADVDVYLTHGSNLEPLPGEVIAQLQESLGAAAPAEWAVHVPGDAPACGLNGIGNVQGRLLNGVRDDALCGTRAWSYTGRFVHVEQKAAARAPEAYGAWITALTAVDWEGAAQHPGYQVLTPNGGEVWTVGQEATITWDSWATDDEVSLALYKDGSYYESITGSTDDDGEYTYEVEYEVEPGTDYTVRIKSLADGAVRDVSDLPLTVVPGLAPPALQITGPNGDGLWELGAQVEVTWTSTNVDGDVKLSLHRNGSYIKTIASHAANTGSYAWEIPLYIEPGDGYTVRVRSVDDTSVKDFSDTGFEIAAGAATPSLTVVGPNGCGTWAVGETVLLEWTSTAIDGQVKLSLHKDGGYYKTIDSHTANTGSYEWVVPGSVEPGDGYTVRVRSVDDTSVKDFSDAAFEILAEDQPLQAGSYPNPFNPETSIRFQLTAAEHVTVEVFDMIGQRVALLVDEVRAAGLHEARFDAGHLASGTYFYRVRTGSAIRNGRMLLMK